MRHRKHKVRFGRQRSHYKATLRQLVSALIINKSISTTNVKAKEASVLADKLVRIGKEKTLANQRKAYSVLRNRNLVLVLFNEIAPLFKNRNGGYTRVILTRRRHGDNAQMAVLEFIEKPKTEPAGKKEKKEKKKKEIPQPSSAAGIEKTEKPREPRPKKLKRPVEKKEEPKKATQPIKEPESPKEPQKPKPGFFRRLFGRKKEK